VHFQQIWIEPAMEDIAPSYKQISFAAAEKQGRLKLLAGPHGSDAEGSAVIHQDARIYASELRAGETLRQPLGPGRYGWVQVALGSVSLNGQNLREGDGAAINDESELVFAGVDRAGSGGGGEFLFFDLP
jgi:redox-sensitive bicupin YhaK (pirin superfamily)